MAEGDAIRQAIQELQSKLERQQRETTETKKAINTLCSTIDEPPMFDDLAEPEQGRSVIRADQYFRKSITVAAQEFLKQKGSAATLTEIIDALKNGGCDVGAVPLRNVKISLAKNSRIFAQVNDETFGLWEFYGGPPRGKKVEGAVEAVANGADAAETIDALAGQDEEAGPKRR